MPIWFWVTTKRAPPGYYAHNMEGGASPPLRLPDNLHFKIVPKIEFPAIGVVDEKLAGAVAEDLTVVEEVGAVDDAEGFADIVVGDEYADSFRLEISDDLLNVGNADGIDSTERLVHENVSGVHDQRARDLEAPAFAAAECVCLLLTQVSEPHGFKGLGDLCLSLRSFEWQKLRDDFDILPNRQAGENRRLLGQVSDPHACALIDSFARDISIVD